MQTKFSRTDLLLGQAEGQWLRQQTITIAGLGAVGGYALEGLARVGINHFRLIDFDVFSASNINRQINALESTIALKKIEVARDRILDINPNCIVDLHFDFICNETVESLLAFPTAILVDAIDSLSPKLALLEEAYKRNIPTVSSMGAALRTDPTKLRVADLMATTKCPLAKHLRKKLRRREIGEGITAVYSVEDVIYDYQQKQQSVIPSQENEQFRGRQRNTLGSLPTLTGIFGLAVANTTIFKLLELYQQEQAFKSGINADINNTP